MNPIKFFTYEAKTTDETVKTPDIERSRWRIFHGATNAQMALWAVFGPYIEEEQARQQAEPAQQPVAQSNIVNLDDYRNKPAETSISRETAARDMLTQVHNGTAPDAAPVIPINAAQAAVNPFDAQDQQRDTDVTAARDYINSLRDAA